MTDQQQLDQVPPATATAAQTQLDTLTSDSAWTERFVNGDATAKREFEALTTATTGGSTAEDVVASIMAGKGPQFGNSVERQMTGVVEGFRDIGIRDEVTQEFLSGKQVSPAEYQAVASLKRELMSDAQFVKDYLGGNVKAQQRMTIINAVMVNGANAENSK